jgi:hypothetical protein
MLLGKCQICVKIIRFIRIDTLAGSPLLNLHTWCVAVDTFVQPL